ncbi:hypothetical protein [Weissella fangxianensis]|uniref:hypothetical protein n=1 Tax=Weissella fangxianensis TaxID=2953879 RepID=UPI002157E87E|nr:hypothetical protein [Weissella fangxianensis]
MIDWKYGTYATIWWIILLATYSTAKEVTNNFGRSFLTLCLAIIIVIIGSYFYEHTHPQFQEKNRTSTVNHLRAIWVLFILVVYLAVALQVPHSDIFFLTCMTLAQSVPAFFTKYAKSKSDKN